MEKIVEELCQKHGTLTHVKKNITLFDAFRDKDGPYVYYLVEGICALCGNSYQGQEHVFLYHMAGQMMGINPFIAGFGSGVFSYIGPTLMTKTNCTLYRIPVPVFQEYLRTNLEFSNYVVRLLSKYYHLALAHLKQIQEDSSVTVICRFLLSMCSPQAEGLVVPRFFTNEEISQYSGVHTVTVGRIIAHLLQSGYVKRIPAGLLIQDQDALRRLVENCETFKY